MKKVVLVHGVSFSYFFMYVLCLSCLVGEFLSASIVDLSRLIKLIFFFFSLIGWKDDGVPLWEKQFCILVGKIPWGKIVETRKCMYPKDKVVRWDDSASEEAFQNAKKRYWTKINGLPCDVSLPDPDIYIDEIDWDTNIDPELIKDLEGEGPNMNQGNNYKPWGCYNVVDLGALNNEAQGLGQWESWRNYVNKGDNDGNPWESGSLDDPDFAVKDKVWKTWDDGNSWGNGGDEPWDINQGGNYVNKWDNGDDPWKSGSHGISAVKDKGCVPWGDSGNNVCSWNQQEPKNLDKGHNTWESRFGQNNGASQDRGWRDCGNGWGGNQWDNGDNSWKRGFQGVASVKDKGWGDFENKDWGWNQEEPMNLDNDDNHWESRFRQNNGALKDRGWRDCRGNGWGRKQWEKTNNGLKHMEFKRTDRGTWNEGSQKRGGYGYRGTWNVGSRGLYDRYQKI